MRHVVAGCLLAACGTPSERVVPRPPADAAPAPLGCAGHWSLVELFPTQTSCTGLARKRAAVIVDVVDGAYRARHATGGVFTIMAASPLGADCVLGLADSGHIDAIDTSYEMEWHIGGAARGVYRDLEAWTQCTHEFRALAVRRDVTAADTTLDVDTLREAILAWWPRYAGCRRRRDIPTAPGRATIPAEAMIDADGRVMRLRAHGRTHHVECSTHGCECLAVPNPTGQPQTVSLQLPVP